MKSLATSTEIVDTRAAGVERQRERSGAQRRGTRRLGNTEVKKHPEVSGGFQADNEDIKTAFSRALWSLQRTMWEITESKRLAGCHRWRAPGTAVARLDWQEEKGARFGGLQDSHSVWASPISAARIGKSRAEEIKCALRTWVGTEDAITGHDIAFLTLTLRHSPHQSLKEVWDTISKAWAGVTQTAAWRGSNKVAGDKANFGISHWIKSVEVTHGKNGWHVHLHTLLLTEKRLSDAEKELLESRIYSRWSAAAQRKGFKAPSRERGTKLELAATTGDIDSLASYMAKSQLSGLNGLANEITGSVVKAAKGENRSPFQVLESLGEKKTSVDLAIWYEWETNSHGRRQIAWSKGAKAELGVNDLTDEQIINDLDEEFNAIGYTIATIDAAQWSKIQSDTDLRSAITEEVSKANNAPGARVRARRILTALGIDHESVLISLAREKKEPPMVNVAQAREIFSAALLPKNIAPVLLSQQLELKLYEKMLHALKHHEE